MLKQMDTGSFLRYKADHFSSSSTTWLTIFINSYFILMRGLPSEWSGRWTSGELGNTRVVMDEGGPETENFGVADVTFESIKPTSYF